MQLTFLIHISTVFVFLALASLTMHSSLCSAVPVIGEGGSSTGTNTPSTSPVAPRSSRRRHPDDPTVRCFTSHCGAEFYRCPDNCSYGYRHCSKARMETVCCC